MFLDVDKKQAEKEMIGCVAFAFSMLLALAVSVEILLLTDGRTDTRPRHITRLLIAAR